MVSITDHISYIIMTVLFYLIVQLFVVFKCFTVSKSKKLCFWIVTLYTIVFYAVEAILYIPGPNGPSFESILTASILHTVNTFILFGIITVFSGGFLPKNFLVIMFYYDILTVLYGTLIFLLIGFLPGEIAHIIDFSADLYEIHNFYQFLHFLPDWIMLAMVIITGLLFNKTLIRFINKIPDNICTVIFAASFISYVLREFFIILNHQQRALLDGPYLLSSLFNLIVFSLTLLLALLYAFISYSYTNRKYEKLLTLELNLQYRYYQNISQLHTAIRHLKHDLSNHITALNLMNDSDHDRSCEYKANLLSCCGEIDSQIRKQIKWQKIPSDILSNRERYEVYQYMEFLANRYRLSFDDILIKTGDSDGQTEISFIFPSYCSQKMRVFLLKQNILYRLMTEIAKAHNGSVNWQKGEGTCSFFLILQ
ncbi:MAG: hypothetical protein Q4C25_08740 [Bacillota bacterium]|nr:hypothetical protein [Bacillota bacterium]